MINKKILDLVIHVVELAIKHMASTQVAYDKYLQRSHRIRTRLEVTD